MRALNIFGCMTATVIVLPNMLGQTQDPQSQNENQLADAARQRGFGLMQDNRYDEAVCEFREVVRIWKELGKFSSENYHDLARALTAADRKEEALEAYREGVLWDPVKGELWLTGRDTYYAMDYAILLAKCGRTEEAKAMYYYGLRRFNEFSDPGRREFEPAPGGRREPFPFLVVFDPDPTMHHWEYSPAKLIAAAAALIAKDEGRPIIELLKDVRNLMPDWIVPAMDLVWQPFIDGAEADRFVEAASLAKTPEEREWISAYRDVFTISDRNLQRDRWQEVANKMAAIGASRRKASVVLEQARQNLKNIHNRIAIEWRG